MKFEIEKVGKALLVGAFAYAGVVYVAPMVESFPILSYAIGPMKVAGVAAAGLGIFVADIVMEAANIK